MPTNAVVGQQLFSGKVQFALILGPSFTLLDAVRRIVWICLSSTASAP